MKYVKPDLYMEEFELNTNVAACTRLEAGQELKAIEVECVASKSDVIFTEDTNGCVHDVVLDENGSGYRWITYNGDLYFAWISSESDQAGQNTLSELNKILKAGGIDSWNAGNGKVWHAGPADNYLEQLYSHST